MGVWVDGVGKTFRTKFKETEVFKEISLKIADGEFVSLIGPSGCGKSTLLNIIAGLEKATSGQVYIGDEMVSGPGPDRIVMFQEAALFPWLKVIDNVTFGLKIKGQNKEERQAIAMEFLQMTHLTNFKNAYVHELSGGMRQRVALARCLTMDSKVLLMDEPFGALDSQTRLILQTELQRIWEQTKKTIVMVTHSVEEAVLLSDRIFIMSTNPGGIKAVHEVNLPRPRHVNAPQVVSMMEKVLLDIKEEVEKVAKAEFDANWHLE